MKKNISILLLSLCIVGGLVFYKTQWLSPIVKPSEFLSQNVLLYLNYKDLGTILNDFKKTPLAKAVDSIDYVKMALDIEVPLATVEKMRQIKDFFTHPANRLLLDELFSKEFTIALNFENDAADPEQYIQRNLIIVSRPKHTPTFLKLLSSSFSEKLKMSSSQYGRYIINKIEVQTNVTVTFASVGSLLLITMSERSLRVALDRYDNTNKNLNDNSVFDNLEQLHNDSNLFCYFSIEKIQDQLKSIFDPDDTKKNNFLNQLYSWNGFTSGGYWAWRKEMLNEDVVTIYFDKRKLNSNAARFLDVQPEKDVRIHQVPTDVLTYYWTNTFYPQTLWDIYVAETKKQDKDLVHIEQEIRSLTGKQVDEIISLFGNRFSLMIKEPSTVDFLPVPNITLVLDLNDLIQARSTLLEILTINEVPHNNLSYKGVDLTYWGEAVQPGLQPVISFYDDSIYLSTSVKMLKEILDTIIYKNGITTDQKFLEGADFLLLKNNSIGYVHLAPALDVSKELVSWGGTMLAIQNRKAAYKSKIVIDGFIQPILDGLKMYSTIAIRTYMDKGVITIESRTTKVQNK